jgi:hypothetical protein
MIAAIEATFISAVFGYGADRLQSSVLIRWILDSDQSGHARIRVFCARMRWDIVRGDDSTISRGRTGGISSSLALLLSTRKATIWPLAAVLGSNEDSHLGRVLSRCYLVNTSLSPGHYRITAVTGGNKRVTKTVMKNCLRDHFSGKVMVKDC